MRIVKILAATTLTLTAVTAPKLGHTAIIGGTITDWKESGPVQTIGDNVNNVSLWWSINTFDRGWFYGSSFQPADSDVAFAEGVTDVSQISDASIFTFTDGSVGPFCDAECDPDQVGDFLVWKNINTGHFGVLRIDDIQGNSQEATLSGTWWFQTDGTGDFTSNSVPEPLTILGSATALGFGALLKRESSKKKNKS
jgi:hypothetical protein